jgi:hypothetical protein
LAVHEGAKPMSVEVPTLAVLSQSLRQQVDSSVSSCTKVCATRCLRGIADLDLSGFCLKLPESVQGKGHRHGARPDDVHCGK